MFFYTRHVAKAYSPEYYKTNPVITEKTANELTQKKAKMIGLDSWTPDNAPYTLHKLLFKHDILIVENLVNLDQLVGKRFQCHVLPLKILDADGAPCRVIAQI